MRKTTGGTSNVYYLLSDHLGSTVSVVNPDGTSPRNSTYYAFGASRLNAGGAVTDKLFTGQQLEASTGLYMMGARWYDPSLGRFISPDSHVPDGMKPQTFNRYSYVYNNPLRYVDPTGNEGWDTVVQITGDYVGGMGQAVGDAMTANLSAAARDVAGVKSPDSPAFYAGRQAGDSIMMGVGLVEMGAAGGADLLGTVTGPGDIAIVGATSPLLVHGAATVGTATLNSFNDSNQFNARIGRDGSNTLRNFRSNLMKEKAAPTGMKDPQAHHMLPQELESQFKKIDPTIDVNDAKKWGAWWEGNPSGNHQTLAKQYNNEWRQWLARNPGATMDDVKAQAQVMSKHYGLDWQP